VREAVVLAREDMPGDKRLVAYVTGDTAQAPEALRAHLAAGLPEYMVPAAYVQLDALPLTPNGKLDRRALPAPEDTAFGVRAYEPPQGPIETALAALWSELLHVERVGRHDNFFDLGGHSLQAVTLMERMRRLGWPMEARPLFTTPTLAALAASVGSGASIIAVPPNRLPPPTDRKPRGSNQHVEVRL
jgi:aryl carrier-like protein